MITGQSLPPEDGRKYTAVDASMLNRVLKSRNAFLHHQELMDGILVSAAVMDGDGNGFNPVEIVEKVAEALAGEVMDACMNEFVGMMDTFVDQVVENEFDTD